MKDRKIQSVTENGIISQWSRFGQNILKRKKKIYSCLRTIIYKIVSNHEWSLCVRIKKSKLLQIQNHNTIAKKEALEVGNVTWIDLFFL